MFPDSVLGFVTAVTYNRKMLTVFSWRILTKNVKLLNNTIYFTLSSNPVSSFGLSLRKGIRQHSNDHLTIILKPSAP